MNSIIANDIFLTLKSENIREYLNKLLILMDELDKHRFKIKTHEDIWLFKDNDEYFYDWLYSKNPPELVDLKTEFYKRIERAVPIKLEEYNNYESKLDKSITKYCDYNDQFLFINNDDNDEIHIISSLLSFYHLRRWYLEKCVNQKEFVKDLPLLFPNLHFHKNLISTLRTLNNDFNIIRPEIVAHLTALELFHQSGEIHYSDSNTVKCKKFEAFSRINCSTENKRKQASKLSFVYSNNDATRKINCECHTKFNTFGKDRTKQDRIYFSFGQKGCLDEKIIIYHIGNHI
ncbi:hypothetical protein C2D64_08500 [Listeria ivanovii]|uniref:hypothetical protein n=1 Tax=Listeria ivanovii TaxID=1638 RepID=UPI000DA89E5B|nr:hypothetical protein [Listeria ivanovii]PZG33373.1 hypothetical protein C2D64_08500 [Listeria ivanovii]PZG47120.1 hypothetical protein C2D66_08220 [Listeria ivanovii]PZH11024.1 hypothetical protein C2D65_08450 [Listeria ivanovii]